MSPNLRGMAILCAISCISPEQSAWGQPAPDVSNACQTLERIDREIDVLKILSTVKDAQRRYPGFKATPHRLTPALTKSLQTIRFRNPKELLAWERSLLVTFHACLTRHQNDGVGAILGAEGYSDNSAPLNGELKPFSFDWLAIVDNHISLSVPNPSPDSGPITWEFGSVRALLQSCQLAQNPSFGMGLMGKVFDLSSFTSTLKVLCEQETSRSTSRPKVGANWERFLAVALGADATVRDGYRQLLTDVQRVEAQERDKIAEQQKTVVLGTICSRIKESKVIGEYTAKVKELLNEPATKAYTSEVPKGREERVNYPVLDTKDSLIMKWVKNSFEREYMPERAESPEWVSLMAEINKCAYELRKSDRLLVFASSIRELGRLNAKLDSAMPNQPQQEPRRTINAEGQVVFIRDSSATVNWGTREIVGTEWPERQAYNYNVQCWRRMFGCSNGHETLTNFTLLMAFTRAGGQEFVEALGAELLTEAQSRIASIRRERQQEVVRFRQIRAGSFQRANNCDELAQAFSASYSLAVGIEPSNRMHYVSGVLQTFESDKARGSVSGFMNTESASVIFKTTPATVWIDRPRIALNKKVVVVGRYTTNVAVLLTNRARTTAAVLTASCVESWR